MSDQEMLRVILIPYSPFSVLEHNFLLPSWVVFIYLSFCSCLEELKCKVEL